MVLAWGKNKLRASLVSQFGLICIVCVVYSVDRSMYGSTCFVDWNNQSSLLILVVYMLEMYVRYSRSK